MRHKIRAKYLNELMGITSRQPREEVAMNEDDLQLLATPLCQQIIAIITQERQLDKEVNLYDHLGIDLGYDSLSRIELIAILEKKLNLKIAESLLAQIAIVRELVIAIGDLIAAQKRQPAITLQVHVKENLWQEILQQDPAKTITDKIDIKPSWFGKIADLLFCGGLYIIAKLCWRVKIIGLKNLPKNVPFILCPNHASYLDAFLIAAVIPNWLKLRIFFLGYSFFFEVPIVRNLVKIGRIIPLDPGARLIEAMQACSYVLRNNKAMCIFPEGGRTTDGEIKAFKKGIGILAKELNIALVPVYIDGAFAVLPRGQKFPRFNNIKITFGKPSAVDYLRKKGQKLGAVDDYEAIALAIRDEVKNLCE
jgi:long-chain acyl-CoA synthetase